MELYLGMTDEWINWMWICLFTKSNDGLKCDSFSVFLRHILGMQHAFLRVNLINSTQFIPNHIKINIQTFYAKWTKILWKLLEIDLHGDGDIFNILGVREGAFRGGDLGHIEDCWWDKYRSVLIRDMYKFFMILIFLSLVLRC